MTDDGEYGRREDESELAFVGRAIMLLAREARDLRAGVAGVEKALWAIDRTLCPVEEWSVTEALDRIADEVSSR